MDKLPIEELVRRKDWTGEQWKNSPDKIDRLAYFISYLSPHNLWKAVEAIEEFKREELSLQQKELRGHLEGWRKGMLKKSEIVENKSEALSASIRTLNKVLALIEEKPSEDDLKICDGSVNPCEHCKKP